MFTLICGIPNAGKTTYSSQFKNVIHMDEIIPKKKNLAYEEVCDMIAKSNDDIYVEGVFTASHIRKQLCDAYNGRKICIWLNTSVDECIAREDRQRATFIIRNCAEFFSPPTFKEGWDEIIIIENNQKETHFYREEDEDVNRPII